MFGVNNFIACIVIKVVRDFMMNDDDSLTETKKQNVKTKRDLSYHSHYREDILRHIPSDVKCILSVGCGCGVTEAELVKHGAKVVGAEINPEAAKIARQRGLTILEGDASEIDVGIAGEQSYDCIIYADILEHLSDPVGILRRHVERLQSNGTVIVSVPNFRHHSVFWQLFIRGRIKYEDAGILDRTHFRITTRKMVLEWFDAVEIKPVSCNYHISRRRYKLLSVCLFGLAREFIASQICLIGKKC